MGSVALLAQLEVDSVYFWLVLILASIVLLVAVTVVLAFIYTLFWMKPA